MQEFPPSPDQEADPTTLLPYYVYVLLDPRDRTVFYVGVGRGYRIEHHAAEAMRLLNSGQELESPKHHRIAELLSQNLKPGELVIGRYGSEPEAFAVEATLIKWVYGFDRLTNLIHGHGARFIRSRDNFDSLSGIDVPERTGQRDGAFAARKLDELEQSGATAALADIRRRLVEGAFEVRDFSDPVDRAFDPGRSNGWLGLLVRFGRLDILVSFSKTQRFALAVANTLPSRTEEARRKLLAIEEKLGESYACNPAVNTLIEGQGRYRHFAGRPKFASIEELIQGLDRIRDA